MDKPSSPEEDYFAREEIEKRYKLAKEIAAKQKAADAESMKAFHFMFCPKCGNKLETIQFRGIEIDRCFHCHGTWLDEGELDKLAGADEKQGLLAAVANVFKRSTP